MTPEIANGKPRIAGRRVTVQNAAIWHEWLGQSADEIAADHNLSLADVYAALTCCCDHKTEIDQAIRDDEAFINELKKKTQSLVQQQQLSSGFSTGHFFKMIGNMSLLRRFFVLGRRYGYKYITATRFIRKFRYGKPRQGCNIYRKSSPISPNQPR